MKKILIRGLTQESLIESLVEVCMELGASVDVGDPKLKTSLKYSTTGELLEELKKRGEQGDVPAMVEHSNVMLEHLPYDVLRYRPAED